MFIHAKLILHFKNVEANILFIKNEEKQKKNQKKIEKQLQCLHVYRFLINF